MVSSACVLKRAKQCTHFIRGDDGCRCGAAFFFSRPLLCLLSLLEWKTIRILVLLYRIPKTEWRASELKHCAIPISALLTLGVGVFRVTIIENGASAKNINIFPQITEKFCQTNKCGILMTIMAQIHLSGTFWTLYGQFSRYYRLKFIDLTHFYHYFFPAIYDFAPPTMK